MLKKISKFFFLLTCIVKAMAIQAAYVYTLSVCAIFKNEAPYLKEWLEYHKLVGVEHFYLYNNGSEDHYEEVLRPYIEANEVTLFDYPDRDRNSWENKIWAWVYSTQVSAYEHAFQIAKSTSKWIAAIDIDEFIVPVKADLITQVLEKYEKHFPGVEIFWRIYGTSDLDEIPANSLMIEVLNRYSSSFYPFNSSYKTILKPDQYKNFSWPPHRCSFIDGRRSYQAERKELVINHYINRGKNYFYSNKIKNKEHMDNVTFNESQIAEMLKVGNELEDNERTIHRFVPALHKKMGFQTNQMHVDLISDFDVSPFGISPALFKKDNINLNIIPKITSIKKAQSKKVIIFNQIIDPSILFKIPKENLVYFLWEPWEIPQEYYACFSRVYTWNDDLVDNVKFFKFNYPHLMPMEKELPSFEKKKLCVMIAGCDFNPAERKNDLYSERLKMVEFFETKPKGELEIYGRNWQSRYYRDYRFSIPGWHSGKEKISVLKNYRFSICFENTKNINGYITEKIFCCMAAGCVPIYWGANNIESYIPKGCYIDYRDFQSREELYQFIKRMPKSVYEQYLDNIRVFLNSDNAKVFSADRFLKNFYTAMGKSDVCSKPGKKQSYYSQIGQDKFLHENIFKFKREGVFVDIEAHNGIDFSNTKFFEDNGWKGICIEPIPEVFEKLKQNRKCLCIRGCISDKKGVADFLRVKGEPEMLSGLIGKYDSRHLERIRREVAASSGGSTEVIKVNCYLLNEILQENHFFHVDYLTIDTEGNEFEILKSIDFSKFDIDVIDVENNYKDERIGDFLSSKNYKLVCHLYMDDIYRKIK